MEWGIKRNLSYLMIIFTFVGVVPHLFMADPRFPQIFSKIYEKENTSFFRDITPARFESLFMGIVWALPYYTCLITTWHHLFHRNQPCLLFLMEAEALMGTYKWRLGFMPVLLMLFSGILMLAVELSIYFMMRSISSDEQKDKNEVAGSGKLVISFILLMMGIVLENLMLLHVQMRILGGTGVTLFMRYPSMMLLAFFLPVLYRNETVFRINRLLACIGTTATVLLLHGIIWLAMPGNMIVKIHFYQIIASFALFLISGTIMTIVRKIKHITA